MPAVPEPKAIDTPAIRLQPAQTGAPSVKAAQTSGLTPAEAYAPSVRPASVPQTGGVTPKPTPDGSLPALTLYTQNGQPATTVFNPEHKPRTEADRIAKTMGQDPCETCRTRRYQDASNDAGVSFKSPQHVSPEASAGAVSSHERQHVTAAYNETTGSDTRVVSTSVRLFTSCCPECGRMYVSGGVTNVRTAQKKDMLSEDLLGLNVNQNS